MTSPSDFCMSPISKKVQDYHIKNRPLNKQVLAKSRLVEKVMK